MEFEEETLFQKGPSSISVPSPHVSLGLSRGLLSIGGEVGDHFQEELLYLEGVLDGESGIGRVNDVSELLAVGGDMLRVRAGESVLILVSDRLHYQHHVIHFYLAVAVGVAPETGGSVGSGVCSGVGNGLGMSASLGTAVQVASLGGSVV